MSCSMFRNLHGHPRRFSFAFRPLTRKANESLSGVTLLFCLLSLFLPSLAHATDVQEVESRGGIKAWLVEDHKLPLIAMGFAFRGGVEQDPADKQGLATLTMNLLTEGAGPYDAAAFQKKLADHSITLHFGAGRDALNGSLKALSADRHEAFNLLALALTQPRFDAKDFERLRGEQLTALRTQLADPGWQARYALLHNVFRGHPYGGRRLGTTQTLAAITCDDIRGFSASHLARDNLVVAVAGDIPAAELGAALDQIFGKLPRRADLVPISEIEWPQNVARILVPREGTQTELLFAMPGPKQDSSDWYAVQIANYALGGGGFSSRLMQDVRDKKGLTYGISTELAPADHAGMIVGQAATDNPKTREAWEIAQATMRRFYDDGATLGEVNSAKDFLTGSLPLALTSTDKIAGALVTLQLERRDPNYLDKRNDLFRNVSLDEVNIAIRHWFNPDRLTLAMVGKSDGMASTEMKAQAKE